MLRMNDRHIEGVKRRHILQVANNLRASARENLMNATTTQIEAIILHYRKAGPAWSVMVGDECIAIGGVYLLWQGVGEGWIFSTPAVERHAKHFASTVSMAIEEATLAHGLHRMQMACRLNDRRACRFAEWLGFRAEGVMLRYGIDGADFVRYAWVRD